MGRNYAGESPQDREARRRRQLLDAGLEVFGTTGFRKATVRQLCREARVADRYFYEEFSNTEDLLLAVYHDCLDRLQGAVLEALAPIEADAVPAMAAAGLEAFLRCAEEDPHLARVAWYEILGVSARIDAAYMERTRSFGEFLLGLLDQRGLLVDAPAQNRDTIVNALVGGVSQVVMNWVYDGYVPERTALVPPLVAVLTAISEIRPAAAR